MLVVDGDHGASSFSDFVSRAGVEGTLHQTPIEALSRVPSSVRMVRGCEGLGIPHVLDTHWFPRAVPFKTSAGMCVPEHATSMCGARVRGRELEEEQETAVVAVEREGCPINADRCRVLVPMMPMRPRWDTLEQRS